MIYGFSNFESVESYDFEFVLKEIYHSLIWDSSTLLTVNSGCLVGGAIHSQTAKMGKKDFYFFCPQEEVIVFMDGHIYNAHEVAQKLSLSVPLNSIPKLVYYAFIQWGDNFPAYFNGDFAICIFQLKNKRASFYRDHLGIRPLAVTEGDNGVYFAEDPMGLCSALYGNKEPERKFLVNHFAKGSPIRDYRMLPNHKVENIRPGYGYHFQHGEWEMVRYWEVDRIRRDKNITFNQCMEDLDFLLHDAVRIRADKNAKAAAHVSAGIDSSFVAALARQFYPDQEEFLGFTWSPDYPVDMKELMFDERERVIDTCRQNDIAPVFTNFKLDDYIASNNNWRHPSLLLTENIVASQAQKKNVDLIFNGWGGDDFVSIGHRGVDASLIKEGSWKSFLKKYPPSRPKKIVSALLFKVLFPSLRRPYNKRKTLPEVFVYLERQLKTNYLTKKLRFRYGSRRDVHLQILERCHLSQRTTDWFILGRRHGLEYRYPLLDKRIVEYMLKIPTRCLVGGNNYRIVLRHLSQDLLPKSVLENKPKADPVLIYYYYHCIFKFRDKVLKGSKDFLDNPLLQFVDMEKLEKDMADYERTGDQKLEQQLNKMLPLIVSAHEFIKGYYKNYDPEKKSDFKPGGSK